MIVNIFYIFIFYFLATLFLILAFNKIGMAIGLGGSLALWLGVGQFLV